MRALRRVDKLREDLGLARSEDIIVTLAGSHGSVTRSFSLTDQRPRSIRSVVIGESRILSDNVGYLRIPAMEIDRIPEILEFMDEARNTDALIIDVRGNGGGRLEILRALAPYFLPPDAPPIVTNIAAYRLASHFRPDHLADRPTFRLDHPDWTEVQRAIIRVAQEEFRPAWTLPPGQFSEWHFMLINRQSDRTRRVYHYDRPVAVLSDAHALSATDGFLNRFCEIPGTHLVGQPSSGASGRMRSFTLPESDIEVGISSEVSFRPNGQPFDGKGVAVDHCVAPQPKCFIGESDNMLTAALNLLKHLAQTGNAPDWQEMRPCRQLGVPAMSMSRPR